MAYGFGYNWSNYSRYESRYAVGFGKAVIFIWCLLLYRTFACIRLLASSRYRRSLALSRSSAHLSRLLAAVAIPRLPPKELIMKYFGTVTSYDTIMGHGELKQEAGGKDLPFEKGAFQWDKNVAPTVGQRLSYDVGQGSERQPCALNLQTI